jgi:hypothetical protein
MNRQLARKHLIERLDWLENGMQSKKGQLIQKIRRQKDRQARRSKEKHSVSDEDGTESTVDKLLSDERFAVHLRDLGSSK